MELYTMRYVLAVAEYKNFSMAAQACHVGQPALSQQVSRLEKDLGVALFTRSSRGTALTEAGREFVHMAQEIVQRADALQAKMSLYAGVRRGTLNLGIITSLQCIDFGGLLSAFCGSYPEVSLNIVQDGTYRLFEQLLERKIDAAFLNRPISGIPTGLEFFKLGEDVYSLAVPTIHPLARRDHVSLEELKDEDFIFHQTGQVASELCLAACRKAGFGLGVALLPSEEFRVHPFSGVAELKLNEPIVKEVGVACRKDVASPLVDTAVQFSKTWVR